MVFKYKYLDSMKEDKFKVLDEVKAIKVGNEMAVTLSIGIGIKSDKYNENYVYARNAIDLALGRGGDQVVIKDHNDILYFGGKSKHRRFRKSLRPVRMCLSWVTASQM